MKRLLPIFSLVFVSLTVCFAADDSTYPFISGLAENNGNAYKAAFTACNYLKEKMNYTFSGDTCIRHVPFMQSGRGPDVEPPPNIEYAKLSVSVVTTLTEADKLNGEEWRGIVKLKAEAMRSGSQGKWHPVENAIATVRVYIKNGRWLVGN